MRIRIAIALGALALGASFSASANTIDPDDYARGTNLTNIVPGVTLQWLSGVGQNNTRSDVHASICGFLCDSNDDGAFGDASGVHYAASLDDYADCYQGNCSHPASYTLFEISFATSVGFVTFSDAHLSDESYLIAFDSAGNNLGCYDVRPSNSICSLTFASSDQSNFVTGSLFRAQGDISRVVIGSFDAFSAITEIGYRVPEPGTLALLGLGLAGLGFARRRNQH